MQPNQLGHFHVFFMSQCLQILPKSPLIANRYLPSLLSQDFWIVRDCAKLFLKSSLGLRIFPGNSYRSKTLSKIQDLISKIILQQFKKAKLLGKQPIEWGYIPTDLAKRRAEDKIIWLYFQNRLRTRGRKSCMPGLSPWKQRVSAFTGIIDPE